jgi:SAM-dependent methyltransferase
MVQFNFGKNWKNFSDNALDSEKVSQAREDFANLLKNVSGKTFIDIGFGQGLGLLTATSLGLETAGADINPLCKEVLEKNQSFFPEMKQSIPVVVGSILESSTLFSIHQIRTKYDIVHSWGVLHHTGDMQKAIENTASLVNDKGYFILAIYNRHWSSALWLLIKWIYCHVPSFLQTLLIYLFIPIIFLAKFMVTGKNPLKKERGMNFFYDVIDWVGGYPYEYASIEEMKNTMQKLGFEMLKAIPAQVPTGCNEFIFRKL